MICISDLPLAYYIILIKYNIIVSRLSSQVNTAARMETTSIPGHVQLSATAADLLRRNMPPDFVLEPRGCIAVKGKVRRCLNLVRWNLDTFLRGT